MAKYLVRLVIVVLVVPMLPLLITREWGWWQAWLYMAVGVLGFLLSRAAVALRHPDLLKERAEWSTQEGVAAWDRWLAPLMALGSSLPAVAAALERLWGDPRALGVVVNSAGFALMLSSYGLGTYAMLHNRFFSGHVRIQRERDHHVVSSGPYSWVRHPGYAGTLLYLVGVPLLLDSGWAWIPTACMVGVTVLRTSLEDRFLQAELPGYGAYARTVRYRLVPRVW